MRQHAQDFEEVRCYGRLSCFDQAKCEHEASVELYLQLAGGGKARAEDLTDNDFDAIIAFWSR